MREEVAHDIDLPRRGWEVTFAGLAAESRATRVARRGPVFSLRVPVRSLKAWPAIWADPVSFVFSRACCDPRKRRGWEHVSPAQLQAQEPERLMPSTGIVAVAPFCSAMVVGVGSTVLIGLV